MANLTHMQERFAREYLKDRNGRQAAIRAGYSAKGAEVTASKLLKLPKVRALVDVGAAEVAERVKVEAADVLRELMRLGFADPASAFDEHGALLPLHKMPVDIRRAISSIEVEQQTVDGVSVGTVAKVKFWPKDRGLEMLSKHLGLLTDKVQLTGKDGGALSIHIDLGAGK